MIHNKQNKIACYFILFLILFSGQTPFLVRKKSCLISFTAHSYVATPILDGISDQFWLQTWVHMLL